MSMTYQTIEKLKSMGLNPLAEAYERQLEMPSMFDYPFDQRFSMLIDDLESAKKQLKQDRLFKQSKLSQMACPENLSYKPERGLHRDVMEYLLTCEYIPRSQYITITGKTGTGKSYTAQALGVAAVKQLYSVYMIRLARLFESFQIAIGDGTIQKYRAKLAKFDLLIIDDWGLAPVTSRLCHELLELIDDRVHKGAMIITSQFPVEKWHDYLGEPTMADAILDRLIQRAHRIELKGPSLRHSEPSLISDNEVSK